MMNHTYEVHERSRASAAVADPVARAVWRAERLILAEPGDAHSADSIARAVGTSVRSLFRAFQRQRGYGPMEAVRRARLQRVQSDLLTAGPRDSVTDIAMRWGFFHLGRFAGLYCQRFGELPSATRQRSRWSTRAA